MDTIYICWLVALLVTIVCAILWRSSESKLLKLGAFEDSRATVLKRHSNTYRIVTLVGSLVVGLCGGSIIYYTFVIPMPSAISKTITVLILTAVSTILPKILGVPWGDILKSSFALRIILFVALMGSFIALAFLAFVAPSDGDSSQITARLERGMSDA